MRLLIALCFLGWVSVSNGWDALPAPEHNGLRLTFEERGNYAALIGFTGALYMASQLGHAGKDKYEHCAAGLTSSLVVGLIWKPSAGWIVGVGLGAAKEGADALGTGTPDLADFAWTAGCSTLGYAALEGLRG